MSLEHVENHPFNGVNVKVKKILFSDICSLGEEKQSSNLMIITVANERNNYFIPRWDELRVCLLDNETIIILCPTFWTSQTWYGKLGNSRK